MNDRPKHPSGRPVRRDDVRRYAVERVPPRGYLTPRLRDEAADAIGFIHDFSQKEDD